MKTLGQIAYEAFVEATRGVLLVADAEWADWDELPEDLRTAWHRVVGAIAAKLRQPSRCELPPPGWRCTREAGHDGPCAAWPTDEPS